jgi:demethylmenaquinone methyltransferase / 2-methoxy-6-polyprenyl-1,4-benzoquinol methylase
MSDVARTEPLNNSNNDFTDTVLKASKEDRSRAVQGMFNSIAKNYDLGNTVLSFGVHHYWRRVLVNLLPKSENLNVLDICTGTGDLLPLLEERFAENHPEKVQGIDFSDAMLDRSRIKYPKYSVQQADALALPFEANVFDLASVAFGVRNFAVLQEGLKEAFRVLKPQAYFLVLEFGQPKIPIFSQIYKFYSDHIMPIIGGLVTGNRQAYSYLPETAKQFPCGAEFGKELEQAGFRVLKIKSLFFGIAYAYLAQKKA